MKSLMGLGSLLVVVGFASVHARTAAQLVAEFQRFLPAGYKAQVVWTQGKYLQGNVSEKCVYILDSDTGMSRKITNPDMDAASPHLTADGKRVVFVDKNSGRLFVVNSNGSGLRAVTNGSLGSLEDYYQDPTNKSEWAVTYNLKVNIADGTRVSLPGSVGDDGLRISPDGRYYAACFDVGGGRFAFGIINISTQVKTTGYCSGTCNCNMSPDLTYRLMIQYAGHHEIYVCSAPGISTGTTYNKLNIDAGILAANTQTMGCLDQNGDGFDNTRWVAPDYVIFTMKNTRANPYMVKLSEPDQAKKWLAVQDTLGCSIDQVFMGSSQDARIFDRATGTVMGFDKRAPRAATSTQRVTTESFRPDGRRLDAARAHRTGGAEVRGIVVRRSAAAGGCVSRIEVVQ